jgi:hypothetical protein
MQQKPLVLLLSAAILALAGHPSQAQQATSSATPAPLTRAQVKMERDEFIKTHRWDEASESWVLKQGVEPPAPMKGRAEVLKGRDDFLKNNRFDATTGSWVPLAQPRVISQLSRDQVRKETREFLRTHEWDEAAEAWVARRKIR